MGASVATYLQFQAHIADKLDREDLNLAVTAFSPANLSSTVIRAIEDAEDRIGHDIVSRGGIKHMETVDDSLVTVGGVETVTLPSGFVGAESFAITTNPYTVLTPQPSINALFTNFPSTTSGTPLEFTIVGERTAYLRPIPNGALNLRLVYYTAIPALTTSNTSNWLLVNGLGVYTAAAMVELVLQLTMDDVNAAALQKWQGIYNQKLNDLLGDDRMVRYSGAPQKPSVLTEIA